MHKFMWFIYTLDFVYMGAFCWYLAAAHTRRLVAISFEAFVHITVAWTTSWVTPPSSRTWLVSSMRMCVWQRQRPVETQEALTAEIRQTNNKWQKRVNTSSRDQRCLKNFLSLASVRGRSGLSASFSCLSPRGTTPTNMCVCFWKRC